MTPRLLEDLVRLRGGGGEDLDVLGEAAVHAGLGRAMGPGQSYPAGTVSVPAQDELGPGETRAGLLVRA